MVPAEPRPLPSPTPGGSPVSLPSRSAARSGRDRAGARRLAWRRSRRPARPSPARGGSIEMGRRPEGAPRVNEIEQPGIEPLPHHGGPVLTAGAPGATHFLGLPRQDEAREHRALSMAARQLEPLRLLARQPRTLRGSGSENRSCMSISTWTADPRRRSVRAAVDDDVAGPAPARRTTGPSAGPAWRRPSRLPAMPRPGSSYR